MMDDILQMKEELRLKIAEADELAGAYGEPPPQLSAAIVALAEKIKKIEEAQESAP